MSNCNDRSVLDYEMLLCMRDLEEIDMSKENIGEFFEKIDALLDRLNESRSNLNFNNKMEKTQKNKKMKIKNKQKIENTKEGRSSNHIIEIFWKYFSLFVYFQNVRSLIKKIKK